MLLLSLLLLQGDARPGWPIQLGEVQGQVLVADLNADGAIEIFAGQGSNYRVAMAGSLLSCVQGVHMHACMTCMHVCVLSTVCHCR